MNVKIKQLVAGTWQEIPLTDFKGRKPGELLMSFDGTDTVCEVMTTKGLAYFCGTEKWQKTMSKKGGTLLCRDAALFYPDHKDPLEKVIDVFGDIEKEAPKIEATETQLKLKGT